MNRKEVSMRMGSRSANQFSRSRIHFILSGTLLTLVLMVITGCTNLAAIHSFAQASADGASYTALVDDYVNSPQRKKLYEPATQHPSLDQSHKERLDQKKLLLALHKAIADYMAALGELASDDIGAADPALDSLAKAAKEANPDKGKEVDAISAIAKLLERAVTDGYRKAELKKIIEMAHEPLDKVVSALLSIVESFGEDLKTERAVIEKYYDNIIKSAMNNPPQDASIQLLRELVWEKGSKIEAKIEAVGNYLSLLRKLRVAHEELYQKRDQLSQAQLLSAMNSYGNDIADLYKKIRDLRNK